MHFDASLKYLLDHFPDAWLRLVGLAEGSAEAISGEVAAIEIRDSDLSTVSAQADKVFRINQAEPWNLHIEVQSGYAAGLPDRVLLYNILLGHRTKLPVRSVVVLLTSKADGPAMTGFVRRRLPSQPNDYATFRYDIIRLWNLPRVTLLSGGVGTAPLGALSDISADDLPWNSRQRFKPFSIGDAWKKHASLC